MSNAQRIVITGIGAVSPYGHSIEALCARRQPRDFVAGSGKALPLGSGATLYAIDQLDSTGFVHPRLKRKLDPFTVHGLCAAGMALDSSRLFKQDIDKGDVGVFVGNCLGGWGYTEPQLQALHQVGVKEMGPYVATAWFPAALQGQISLAYGIKGYSKTFSARNVAGIQAIGHGVAAIRAGRAKVALCGASEAVNTPYMQAVLDRYPGEQTTADETVFGREKLTDLAEGAAFLVVEDYEHALARGATVYCEVTGFADHFCPSRLSAPKVMHASLEEALGTQGGERLLLLDGLLARERELTHAAITKLEASAHLEAVDTKPVYGHMFALSGVLETALAANYLSQNKLSARSFDPQHIPGDTVYAGAIVQRLSPQGGVATLGLSQLPANA